MLNTLVEQTLLQQPIVGKKLIGAIVEWPKNHPELPALIRNVEQHIQNTESQETGRNRRIAEQAVVSDTLPGTILLEHGFQTHTVTAERDAEGSIIGGPLEALFVIRPGVAPGHLAALERKLGYTFKNKVLLERALTPWTREYEDLELLGDGILEINTRQTLMERIPDAGYEDHLRHKTSLVKNVALDVASKRLDLGRFLNLNVAGEQDHLRQDSEVLADTMEAIIGAIYMDDEKATPFGVTRWVTEPWLGILNIGFRLTEQDQRAMVEKWARSTYGPGAEVRQTETHTPDGKIQSQVTVGQEVVGQAVGEETESARRSALADVFARHDDLLEDITHPVFDQTPLVPLHTQFPPVLGVELSSKEAAFAKSYAHIIPGAGKLVYFLRFSTDRDKSLKLRGFGEAILQHMARKTHNAGVVTGYYDTGEIRTHYPAFAFALKLTPFVKKSSGPASSYSEALGYTLQSFVGLVAAVTEYSTVESLLQPLFESRVAPRIALPDSPGQLRLAVHSHQRFGVDPHYRTEQTPQGFVTEIYADTRLLGSGEGSDRKSSKDNAVKDAIAKNQVPGQDLLHAENWAPLKSAPPKATQKGLVLLPPWSLSKPLKDGTGGASRGPEELLDMLDYGIKKQLLAHATTHPTFGTQSRFDQLSLVGKRVHALLNRKWVIQHFSEDDAPKLLNIAKTSGAPATAARKMDLGDWLRLGSAHEHLRQDEATLVRAFQALLGSAYYSEKGRIRELEPPFEPFLSPPERLLTPEDRWEVLKKFAPKVLGLDGKLRYDTVLLKDGTPKTTVWIGDEIIAQEQGESSEMEAASVALSLDAELLAQAQKKKDTLKVFIPVAQQYPDLPDVELTQAERDVLERLSVDLRMPNTLVYASRRDQYGHAGKLSLLGEAASELALAENAFKHKPDGNLTRLESLLRAQSSGLALVAWELGLANILHTSAPGHHFIDGLLFTLRTLLGLVYVQRGMPGVRAVLQPKLMFINQPRQIQEAESLGELRLAAWFFRTHNTVPKYEHHTTGGIHQVTILGKNRVLSEAEDSDPTVAKQMAIQQALAQYQVP